MCVSKTKMGKESMSYCFLLAVVSTRKVQKIELNCSLRAIDDYPKFFTEEPPRYDLIVVCLILGLYCVLGIAELITEYGFPAVERISSSMLYFSFCS